MREPIEAEEAYGRMGLWERRRAKFEQRIPTGPDVDWLKKAGRRLSLEDACSLALAP